MFNIRYRQIDTTNIINDITAFNFISKDYYIIGIEITDPIIAAKCHINIDPQHTDKRHNQTAIETVFMLKEKLRNQKNNNIIITTMKPDIDSVGSIALLTMILNDELEFTNDLMLRLNAISLSDKHGRDHDWKDKEKNKSLIHHPEFNQFGIPISLFEIIGNQKKLLKEKVNVMIQYLKTGSIENQKQLTEKSLRKQSLNKETANVDIIIPNVLVTVESTLRGAMGIGYKHAPIVIAKNNSYQFGNEFGKKYTIGQYNEGNINLILVQNDLSELEPGWGGTKLIIGSPQNKSSILELQTIINIVKKYVNYTSTNNI